MTWPLEFIAFMAVGWIAFLRRVIPEVKADWGTVVFAVLALAVFTIGLHAFLGWFHRHWTRAEDARIPSSWSAGWSAATVTIILLLFVAGTATVGIVHQVTWLARSPEPLFASNFEAAYRNQSLSQLRQMAISAVNHERFKGTLPPGASMDEYGRLLHSWQAHLLPYIEGGTLHGQIDFKKSWDDPRNREVFQSEVNDYRSPLTVRQRQPSHDDTGYALSDYAANVHVMGPRPPIRTDGISDGASRTILMGEVSENRKPWGFPANWRDPALGINRTPDGFGAPWKRGGVHFAFADGHADFLSEDIDPEVLRALSTPNGGEFVHDRD
jgi:prepilin-type processing-associated H-X9-DG protein